MKNGGLAQIGNDLKVETKGVSANAVTADNSRIYVSGDVTVTASGDGSKGLYAAAGVSGGSLITVGGNVDVTTKGTGIHADGGSILVSGDATVKSTSDLESGRDGAGNILAENRGIVQVNGMADLTPGYMGSAVQAKNDGSNVLLLGGVSADLTASGSFGLTAYDKGLAYVSGDALINVAGDNSSGIRAESSGDVTVTGDTTIVMLNTTATASGISLSDNGIVNLGGLGISGTGRSGINAADGTLYVAGPASGVSASSADVAVRAKKLEVAATSAGASGVSVGGNGTVTLESGERGTLTADAAAAALYGSGTVGLENIDAAASGGDGSYAITFENAGNVVKADNSTISGDVKFNRGELHSGELTVELANTSVFTGKVLPSDLSQQTCILIDGAQSGLNNYEGNSSKWTVTGDSDLYSGIAGGKLKNDGIVEFAGNGYSAVTVGTLEGTKGLYRMSAEMNNAEADGNGRLGDMIRADATGSNASGVVTVRETFVKVPWYQKRAAQPLFMVANNGTAGDGEATNFTLGNKGRAIEIGSWAYELASGSTAVSGGSYTEWYLKNFDLSGTAHSVLSSIVNPSVWYLETNALYSHIGDFNVERENVGVWGHTVYSKLKQSDAYGFSSEAAGSLYSGNDTELEFYGLTGGIDKRFATNSGQWFNGVMFGYGEGDIERKFGDTDMNSFHVGLYSVYRAESDWYVAGILKYNRYDTDMKAVPRGADAFSNDFDQDGWGASVMAGKQFQLKNDWFIEPQVEFGFHRVKGTSFTTSNGMDVSIDDGDSMRLHGGIAFGRKYVLNSGAKLDLFAKASIVHEFDGEMDVYLYGEGFKTDYSGTWGQYKIGFNYDAGKNYFVNFALNYENGGDHETPFGVELGINWLMGPKSKKKTAEPAAEISETEMKTEETAKE